jgi:hypothetical protein
MSSYPYTLHVTQEFTSGTLAGLTYEGSIGFFCEARAKGWASSINSKNKRGEIDYKVISFRVVRS